VAWNLFTLLGIVLGKSIPGLEHLGLDFSIAATFIALITPLVQCAHRGLRCRIAVLLGAVQLLALGIGAGAVGAGGHDRRFCLQQTLSGASMMVWAVIFGMGLLVFLNRYVFLEPRLPLRLSSNARQFLGFAVPGMLTAICGPIVFMPDHELNLHWSNPYLLSSLVAIALVIYTRNTLLSMLLSMGFFFLLRWWF